MHEVDVQEYLLSFSGFDKIGIKQFEGYSHFSESVVKIVQIFDKFKYESTVPEQYMLIWLKIL